jgi:hypothetical protein
MGSRTVPFTLNGPVRIEVFSYAPGDLITEGRMATPAARSSSPAASSKRPACIAKAGG